MPKTPSMLTRKGTYAGVLAEVVEVLHRGDLARHDRILVGALKRPRAPRTAHGT
jgi:hypothetical protein